MIHLTPFPAGVHVRRLGGCSKTFTRMRARWWSIREATGYLGLYSRIVGVEKVREDKQWQEFARRYTPRVKDLIDRPGLQPVFYTPKAGSVLIWHENLAHGGSARKNDDLTRKSIVSHYFARGAAAYYDSQGTPAWTTPPDDD